MNFQTTNNQNKIKNIDSLPIFESNLLLPESTYLSKRILELGTGLIPLINNSEKCSCEKTCADFCFNRLNHQECNRSICGLSDHLHDVYCNNRPFLRFKNQKNKKYIVECFRLPIKKESRHINSDNLKDGNSHHLTRLILSDNVSKGELIIECIGEMLTDSDVRDRYQKYFKLKNQGDENVMNYSFEKTTLVPSKLFCLIENFIYLDMTQTGNEAKHIRHSCNPNSQAEVWISRPNSHIQKARIRNQYTLSWLKMGIFALNDIEKGTEITIDYENLMSRCTPDLARKSENPTRFLGLLECNCNFENCRKNIGTRKIHEAIEFSEFLIPMTNKKRKKDLNVISKGPIEQDSFLYNKNSLESFLFLREKIIEDQKTWKEHIKNESNKTMQKTLNIFEIDKRLMVEAQNSLFSNFYLNDQFTDSSSRLPLWHLFSSLCWQGYYNHQECCNKHILHNNWWGKFKEISENKNKVFNMNFVKFERPRRSCSNNFGTSIEKNKKYFRSHSLNQIRQKGIFLHIMSHPWLLALNNLTNIDIELGKSWKILLARSIDLARWSIIQKLSYFFNKFKVIDEDLSWPIIDQGLGDDEKCTVCYCHGTLSSCDICSKSIHKSCLKKCNQFIASSSFCLPSWFSSNKINKESYFKELLDYYYQSEKSIRMNETSPYKKNNKTKITVIYNPRYSINTLNGLKNENIQSNLFICHKCNKSVHTNFWLRLKSKEKRIISRNAMKIRFSRAYQANFYFSNNKKSFQDYNDKGPRAIKKQTNIKSSQKYNILRSARLMISHLFIWRQKNSMFKISKDLRIFSELSRNFESKKAVDARWDTLNRFSNSTHINCTIANHDQSNANFSSKDSNLSSRLSISVQDDCQIINSISIEEFINSLKK